MQNFLEHISEIFIDDLNLSLRFAHQAREHRLDEACKALMSASRALPIAYTAFDGDHQQMAAHMRNIVLMQGKVPANPESILGYMDAVIARQTKRGVLLDDLAVLHGCDELWIFTDCPCHPCAVRDLAEGVVVELLYFLKRKPSPQVTFVSPTEMLRNGSPQLQRYCYDYDMTKSELEDAQRATILELANSGLEVDKHLCPIEYYIFDPLDFKYARWLRPRAYEDKRVPLVPSLAIELFDLSNDHQAIARLLIAWARLSSLATYAKVLLPMDMRRSPSAIGRLLEMLWLRLKGPTNLEYANWSDYPIPKARQGRAWPLTKKEGGLR
jgi:hypothetical protein